MSNLNFKPATEGDFAVDETLAVVAPVAGADLATDLLAEVANQPSPEHVHPLELHLEDSGFRLFRVY